MLRERYRLEENLRWGWMTRVARADVLVARSRALLLHIEAPSSGVPGQNQACGLMRTGNCCISIEGPQQL